MSGRTRRLTRQVLRFFVTSIAWATGLGLVTGAIVLIATATAPEHAGPPPGSPLPGGGQNSLPRLAPRTGALAAPGYRVLVAFSGHGDWTTRDFRVKTGLRWQLRWTYRCAPQANAAQFTLLRADLGPGHPIIRTTTENFAPSGRGSEWLRAMGHQHYLQVISACSWQVKVVQNA